MGKKILYILLSSATILSFYSCGNFEKYQDEDSIINSEPTEEKDERNEGEADYLDIDVYYYLSYEEQEEVKKQFAIDGIDVQEATVIAKNNLRLQEAWLYLLYSKRKNVYKVTTTDMKEKDNSFVFDFYGTFDVYDEYNDIDKRFKFNKHVEISKETGETLNSDWTLEER